MIRFRRYVSFRRHNQNTILFVVVEEIRDILRKINTIMHYSWTKTQLAVQKVVYSVVGQDSKLLAHRFQNVSGDDLSP